MVVIREGFGVTVNAEQLIRAMNAVPAALAKELKEALKNSAIEHQRQMRKHFVPYTSRNAGTNLQGRSQHLFQSWKHFNEGSTLSNMHLLITAGGNVVYGPMQELGGKSVPYKQYMTIPQPAALDNRGIVRQSMRPVKGADGKWRTAGGLRTHVVMSKAGNLVVLGYLPTKNSTRASRRLGKLHGRQHGASRGKELLLYVLKEQVNIPARPFFGPAWDETQPYRQAQFDAALERALATATGGTNAS